jgi:5-methylcytosine-specific restriction endonuclease McrA
MSAQGGDMGNKHKRVFDDESGEWFEVSPEQVRIWEIFSKRPDWAEGYRQQVFEDDNHLCHICHRTIARAFQVDHLVSWSTIKKVAMQDPELLLLDDDQLRLAHSYLFHDRQNLRVTHPGCNNRKGNDDTLNKGRNHEGDDEVTMQAAESVIGASQREQIRPLEPSLEPS